MRQDRTPDVGTRPNGFSLVEVVIALGISSFAIVAIVGLIATGLSTSKDSADDTSLAMMAQMVNAALRPQSYVQIVQATNFASGEGTPDLYFDAGGELLRKADGTPATVPDATAFFACTVTRAVPPVVPATTNFTCLQYRFDWPWDAPAANRKEKILFSSVSNGD